MNRFSNIAQLVAVGLLVLGLSNGAVTYQTVMATGSSDVMNYLYTLLPLIGAGLTSGGGFLAKFLENIKGRTSPGTMPILESIKVLIETFNPKIDNGSFSFVFKAGGKEYRCTIEEVGETPAKSGSEAAK